MSYWDRMDKKVWDNSEVMQELEKIYKQSQTADMGINLDKTKIDETKKKVDELTKSVKELQTVSKSSNLVEDGESGSDTPKKRKNKAKKRLLKELNNMANDAINNQNYKLAYKIERAIDSIDFED